MDWIAIWEGVPELVALRLLSTPRRISLEVLVYRNGMGFSVAELEENPFTKDTYFTRVSDGKVLQDVTHWCKLPTQVDSNGKPI